MPISPPQSTAVPRWSQKARFSGLRASAGGLGASPGKSAWAGARGRSRTACPRVQPPRAAARAARADARHPARRRARARCRRAARAAAARDRAATGRPSARSGRPTRDRAGRPRPPRPAAPRAPRAAARAPAGGRPPSRVRSPSASSRRTAAIVWSSACSRPGRSPLRAPARSGGSRRRAGSPSDSYSRCAGVLVRAVASSRPAAPVSSARRRARVHQRARHAAAARLGRDEQIVEQPEPPGPGGGGGEQRIELHEARPRGRRARRGRSRTRRAPGAPR